MPELSDQINDKAERLVTVPDEFLSKIPAAEQQVYDQVVQLMAKMDTKNGQFVINKKNIRIVSDISNLLRQVLLGSSYVEAVGEFARQFDQQAIINQELFRNLFPSFTSSQIADQIVQVAKREAVELFLSQAAELDFVAPLRGTIQQAIYNGSGYTETLDNIRAFIKGSEDDLGALSKYSKTYAHDTFAVSDRTYTSIVSTELKAEWFYYTSGRIATTRAFCKEREGEYFHIKEIEGWFKQPVVHQKGQQTPQVTSRNGQVGVHWAGMWTGESFSTFFVYAGGFNCGHSVLPQSVFSMPITVVKRNIQSGNYKPSRKEAELLGV